jgi:hypothetical protein
MIGTIKNILKEEMLSQLGDWEKNLSILKNGEILTTLVSRDDENGDKLYLFVGFTTNNNITEFSYSFMLVDKNNKPLSGYETEKTVVRKLLPKDIVGKKQIIPVIGDMVRKLLDNVLPLEIYRKTTEKLSDDSLKRYEIITDIMVNEYGYELKNVYIDKYGYKNWILKLKTPNKGFKNEYHIVCDVIGVINEVDPFRSIDFSLLKG